MNEYETELRAPSFFVPNQKAVNTHRLKYLYKNHSGSLRLLYSFSKAILEASDIGP